MLRRFFFFLSLTVNYCLLRSDGGWGKGAKNMWQSMRGAIGAFTRVWNRGLLLSGVCVCVKGEGSVECLAVTPVKTQRDAFGYVNKQTKRKLLIAASTFSTLFLCLSLSLARVAVKTQCGEPCRAICLLAYDPICLRTGPVSASWAQYEESESGCDVPIKEGPRASPECYRLDSLKSGWWERERRGGGEVAAL